MFAKLAKSKKAIAMMLLFCFSMMCFAPTAASAANENESEPTEVQVQENSSDEEKDEQKVSSNNSGSGSKATKVTAKFVNGIDGQEIINPDKYSVNVKEKDPQKIEGWVYTDYKESVDYVYIPKDVPYIVGYTDKTVRPLRWISRSEAAAVFYRLYDGDYPKKVRTYKEGKTFKDLPKNHWAHEDIVTLYECGIISGDNNRFRPEAPITRAELAALAVSFNPDKFTSDKDGESPFKDVKEGKWYEDAVLLAAANEWVAGYPDKTFRPENNVTRTETMAIINRVLQRSISSERLQEIGAVNPYTDIKPSDWYYADAIEATIPHKTEEWHEISYNNGAFNVIEEDFVDTKGNKLAKHQQVKGKKIEAPKEIPGFRYVGYIKHSTYIYKEGKADASITKIFDGQGENAKLFTPGDIVTYTVKVSNAKKATRWIENGYIMDTIPEYLTFVPGSVTVNGKSVEYNIKTEKQDEKDNIDGKDTVETVKVNLGKVGIGKTKTVQFACKIDKDAYDKKIENIATVGGDNIKKEEAKDEGFTVLEGKAYLNIDKTVDKETAKVGEKVKYSIKVDVDRTSKTKAKNVVVTDVIDEHLEFDKGVMIDNKPTNDYTYDEKTRTLTVELGDIDVEKSKTVSFDCVIAEDAYNQQIKNVGVAQGKNADPVTDESEVVQVPEGSADLKIEKEVNDTKLNVGDDLQYTITVQNNRNAETTAHNVVVKDTIPEEMEFSGQVTLNGEQANTFYDAETRELEVRVGALEKGEEAVIVIFGKVAADAYGKDIHNLAVATSDNADKVEDEADVVGIKPGEADGNTITKSANKSIAEPGETVTYTIIAKNNKSATAPWEITITDRIPEGMTFAQNVTLNGKATTDYKYDSKHKVLTLMPEPIEPGKTVKYTFDVTIDEGTEGKTFTNIAVMHDGEEETEVPSNPVEVPIDPAKPSITKVANKHEVTDLEEFEYKVTVKNDTEGDVWKNVTVSDELPKEVSLVSGPFIDGKLDSNYYKSGNVIGIDLVELKPGETVEITYIVQVRKGTQKTIRYDENEEQDVIDKMRQDNTITLTNRVSATGNNGRADATDSNVKVPPLEEVIPEEPIIPDETDPGEPIATKTTEKTIVDLSKDPDNTYTITLENPTKEVWKNVKISDRINTTRAHLYSDSVTVDGVYKKWGSDYQYNVDKKSLIDEIVIPVGDIKPGQKVSVQFKVRFSNDKASEPYINIAVASSDNFPAKQAEAPSVTFMNPEPYTGMHQVLLVGTGSDQNNEWWPTYSASHKFLSLQEACCVVARSLTAEQRGEMTGGNSLDDAAADLSEYEAIPAWVAKPVRLMMIGGAISEKDIDINQMQENVDYVKYEYSYRIVATRNQLGRMLKASGFSDGALGGDYTTDSPSTKTNRIDFANEMCEITKRDKNSDFNGCDTYVFSDAKEKVVQEVSTWHNYVLVGGVGGEIWTFSDKNRRADI